MKLSQFTFDLPLNLIAQHPAKKREDSRMMVINRKTGNIENRHFNDIQEYFVTNVLGNVWLRANHVKSANKYL